MSTSTRPSTRDTTGSRSSVQRAGAWARRVPLLPAWIFVVLMTQIPFLTTIVISFMKWNAYYPEDIGFAGFSNFVKVFTDVTAREAIVVTIVLTGAVVVVSLLIGLVSRFCSTGRSSAAGSCGR